MNALKYFPLFADLENAPVLVAGGGAAAAGKVRLLRKTKARITVIAKSANAELVALQRRGAIALHRRAFQASDLAEQRLVYAATGDRRLDAAVAAAARARAIPVNVVDAPALSTFITPAIVERAPVVVAIGTEGAAPLLAREIKTRLEALLPANFGLLARQARALRAQIAKAVPDLPARRRLWQRLLQGPFRRAILAGTDEEASRVLAAEVAGAAPAPGRVALVGCGPGDPDLLTLKALQRLQDADVVVIDALVHPRILEYARRDAERIWVGKIPGGKRTSQQEINRILLREAAAGKVVARLKGGDPLIFGRAGEEMAALEAAGIACEVIPGVSAAQACAARLGLPLTRRNRVRQFSLVTGAAAEGEPDLDWPALARKDAAFAVYMGVGKAPLLRRRLLDAGAHPSTPCVIMENGTLQGERALATTLEDLTEGLAELGITGPAVIFIGLDWSAAGLARPEHVALFRRARPITPTAPRDALAATP
jgi:uroporphyrin-III C-methyltransferase/precorrin-2 dehydrogenase/sirohydrochlorin ferrochelatase